MGSSGGTASFRQPSVPTPPNVAGYGSSVPFQPNFVNFLGNTNVPSTGLTPGMLQQIDSGAYLPKQPPPQQQTDDRGLLAQLLAQLQKPKQAGFGSIADLRARNRRDGTGAQRNTGGR